MLSSKRYSYLVLLTGFLAAFIFRFWLVNHNQLNFGFDQSRDAFVSREIWENKDFKLLGPSASGTHDTVYHGVLYYYVIGPLYTISQGNPLIAALGLAFIASFSVIPLFFLTKDLTKSVGWSAVVLMLYAFSAESAYLATWLSNPSLAILPIAVYYWSLYRVFGLRDNRFIYPLFIAAGLNLQSALWLIYYLIPILAGIVWFWYQPKGKTWLLVHNKQLFLGFILLMMIVASIVLGQIKLWSVGIFNLGELGKATFRNETFQINDIVDFFRIYVEKSLKSLLPTFPIGSLFLFIWLIYIVKSKLKPIDRIFFLTWYFAPLGLFLWHARNNLHILIGLEMCLMVLLAMGLQRLTKILPVPLHRLVPVLIVFVYLLSQTKLIQNSHQLRLNTFSSQSGTFLADQLQLIETTYQQANGQPFSISSYTNPLGYNVTWSYLYNWYGLNKYGYKPVFFGPDQAGLFGGEYVQMAQMPAPIHFTIIEPEVGAPKYLLDQFLYTQNSQTRLEDEIDFGSTTLQIRSLQQDF